MIANGVDGTTGRYLLPEVREEDAARFIQQEKPVDEILLDLMKQQVHKASTTTKEFPPELDPSDARQAGWGILYAPDLDPQAKKALQKLVNYRRGQAEDARTVKEFDFSGETLAFQWLNHQGVSSMRYDPYLVPYYLLLAGGPESIPFDFGFQLGQEYAVGRLDFKTPGEYARYVDSLIDYEQAAQVANAPEIVYFAPSNDGATAFSSEQLVRPLVNGVMETPLRPAVKPVAEAARFSQRALLGDAASKAKLTSVFNPPAEGRVPAILFTASHGLGMVQTDPNQAALNGALVCADWPGPGSILAEHYFAGSDLPAEAHPGGMITFHFACFGGGTPNSDRYAKMVENLPDYSSPNPFIGALPRRLLAHPNGGALACLAHVDRVFAPSIDSRSSGPRYQPYRNILYRLMQGQPVGHVSRELTRLSTQLTCDLDDLLKNVEMGMQVSAREMVALWVERNDAGSFLVLGDPAAHLRAGDLQKLFH